MILSKDRLTRWIWIALLAVLAAICLLSLFLARSVGILMPSPTNTPTFTPTPTLTLTPTVPPTSTPILTPTPTPMPSLRRLAEPRGLSVGVSVGSAWLEEPAYADLLLRVFDLITPENAMKWEVIHPEPDRFDFIQADQIVTFARQHNLKVRGHTLVWSFQNPDWLVNGDFTREQWIKILREHIYTVVGHYKECDSDCVPTVFAWDVVNEAILDDGSLVKNIWLENIGPEYISLAFQFAHEADPQALLFYNDNGGEGLNVKSQAIYDLVKGLKESGVPIHGVGMQAHVILGGLPSEQDLAANMQRLADLGLIVHITEIDVRTQYSTASPQDKLLEQAEIYRQVFSTCLQAANCKAFVTWGLTDAHSWIPGYTGNPDMPLLFNGLYLPKPAYDALIELLK